MEPERFDVSRGKMHIWFQETYAPIMHLSPSTLGVLEKWPFFKISRNNFPSWFSRCNVGFTQSFDITSIFYINASWGWGLRPPVFDLENRSQGDQLNVCERGYLTAKLFVQKYFYQKNRYSCGLNLFAVSLHVVGTARYQFSIPTVRKVPGR